MRALPFVSHRILPALVGLTLSACGSADLPASSGTETSGESSSGEDETAGEDWSETNADVDSTSSGDGDGDAGDGDSGDGDGDPEGDLSCGAALICMEDCSPTDFECIDDCLDIAHPEGRAEAQAVLACTIDNECYDESCLEGVCAAEMLACTSGPMNCNALWDCALRCDGDEICNAECAFESTPLAQSQVAVLVECLENTGCMDENCILEECGDPWLSCTGEMSDSYSCPAVLACYESCDPTELCYLSCAATTSEGDLGDAQEVLTCAADNACADDACIESNCMPELEVCIAGEQSCQELSVCIEACSGAGLCGTNCFADASLLAQGEFNAIVACAELNGCTDQACIDSNCASEIAACSA